MIEQLIQGVKRRIAKPVPKQVLYAHLDSNSTDGIESVRFSYLVMPKRGNIREGSGSLKTIATHVNVKQPTLLVLPSSRGVNTCLDLPKMSDKQRRLALPFTLRNHTLDSVDKLTLMSRRRRGQTAHDVIGYDKKLLDTLLVAMLQHGIKVVDVVLDAQLLPQHKGVWTLFADEDVWLMNTGEEHSWAMRPHMVRPILEQCLVQSTDAPNFIDVSGRQAEDASQLLLALDDSLQIRRKYSHHGSNSEEECSLLNYIYNNLHCYSEQAQTLSLLPPVDFGQHIGRLGTYLGTPIIVLSFVTVCAGIGFFYFDSLLLQQQLDRAQRSYQASISSVNQHLQQLPTAVTLTDRITELQQGPIVLGDTTRLLLAWARIRPAFTAKGVPLTVEKMAYDNDRLTLSWVVQNEETATLQARIAYAQRTNLQNIDVMFNSVSIPGTSADIRQILTLSQPGAMQ